MIASFLGMDCPRQNSCCDSNVIRAVIKEIGTLGRWLYLHQCVRIIGLFHHRSGFAAKVRPPFLFFSLSLPCLSVRQPTQDVPCPPWTSQPQNVRAGPLVITHPACDLSVIAAWTPLSSLFSQHISHLPQGLFISLSSSPSLCCEITGVSMSVGFACFLTCDWRSWIQGRGRLESVLGNS